MKVSSTTIIGGADGPTSVFLATKTSGTDIVFIIAVAVIIIAAIVFLVRTKRKNKK